MNVGPWWCKANPKATGSLPAPRSGYVTTIMVGFAHLLDPPSHQSLIGSSLYYPGSLHKMSSQSIPKFLSNIVHKQTDKQTNQRYQKHNLLCQGGKKTHKNGFPPDYLSSLCIPYTRRASNPGTVPLTIHSTLYPREGNVAFNATPNPSLLNKTCLNQPCAHLCYNISLIISWVLINSLPWIFPGSWTIPCFS